jgi:hypothetical protein
VNRHAYTFCVLEQFWRHLKRREIYAYAFTRWRNPQAQLLDGERWQAIRGDVLTTLSLPDDLDALLAEHAETSSPTKALTLTWCSACWSCWGSPTGRPWPTCPTRRAGGTTLPPTSDCGLGEVLLGGGFDEVGLVLSRAPVNDLGLGG